VGPLGSQHHAVEAQRRGLLDELLDTEKLLSP
jgi:hypothetical protein